MKATVEPFVKAGLNQGGEDLYLRVTIECEGDNPPVDEEIVVELSATDGDGLSTYVDDKSIHDEDERKHASTAFKLACESGYTSTETVRYHTDHYEFEWEGTGKDVLALEVWKDSKRVTVESFLRDPDNWGYCHKPGESPARVSVGCEIYITGNAD